MYIKNFLTLILHSFTLCPPPSPPKHIPHPLISSPTPPTYPPSPNTVLKSWAKFPHISGGTGVQRHTEKISRPVYTGILLHTRNCQRFWSEFLFFNRGLLYYFLILIPFQCCGSGMFIPDQNFFQPGFWIRFFHPGSRIRNLSVPDPDPGTASKNLSILT